MHKRSVKPRIRYNWRTRRWQAKECSSLQEYCKACDVCDQLNGRFPHNAQRIQY